MINKKGNTKIYLNNMGKAAAGSKAPRANV